MKNSYKHLPKEQRKKILLMCDDIRTHSGVANMAREIVINSIQHFNWVNIGATSQHPEQGKIIDISKSIAELTGVEDASAFIYPNSGYGNPTLLRSLLAKEQPDAIFLFTDPRYWVWIFEMEREIRTSIPIFYLNIWDNYPAPMYNRPYYKSCDVLMAISKQTKNINEIVLGEEAASKIIKYVPHGADSETFYPIDTSEDSLQEFKTAIFEGKDYDFVALFNSRNIRRKQPADIVLGYKLFCERIGVENAKRCALILHTSTRDEAGTDLVAVRDAFIPADLNNVYFSVSKLSQKQMNLLYNIADVNVLISSAEGWGLSVTEATLAGTMSILNVTGGLQDQCRFEDENGNWINFSTDFPSNHKGTYKKHGSWVEPIFPASTTLVGSITTPYIYEDRVNPQQIADALYKVYKTPKELRDANGREGREWAISEEAGFTSVHMANRVIEACDEGLATFKPRERYEISVVDSSISNLIQHNFNY